LLDFLKTLLGLVRETKSREVPRENNRTLYQYSRKWDIPKVPRPGFEPRSRLFYDEGPHLGQPLERLPVPHDYPSLEEPPDPDGYRGGGGEAEAEGLTQVNSLIILKKGTSHIYETSPRGRLPLSRKFRGRVSPIYWQLLTWAAPSRHLRGPWRARWRSS